MAFYGCSGLGHCRHLETRYIVVRLLMSNTVMCLQSHALRVPLFSQRDNFEVAWDNHHGIFPWDSLLTGIYFSFHMSASFSFLQNSCTCQWEFVGTREGDPHTSSSQNRCFQRSYCYAPIGKKNPTESKPSPFVALEQ